MMDRTMSASRSGSSRERGAEEPRGRSNAVLLVMTLVLSATLGMLGVVLLQLIAALVTPPPPIASLAAPECVEGNQNECEAGEICEAGRCVAAQEERSCQLGDRCGDESGCTCAAGLACADGECRPPQSGAMSCDSPKIQEFLRGISAVCNGEFDTCLAADLEQFAVTSEIFDEVLAMFPSTITVHYPDNSPPVAGTTWPPIKSEMRRHYRERLAHPYVAKALASAKDVLLIGRSSEGGSDAENYDFSRRRLTSVVDMLLENAGGQTERTALQGKIRRVLLSNRRLIEPDFFHKHFTNRLIAWSGADEGTLRARIAGFDKLRGRPHSWTNRVMNQVVFVVPLPCPLPGASAAGGK